MASLTVLTVLALAARAAFQGYILGSTDWLRPIWDNRAAFSAKPAPILWGTRDIAFRRKELNRWRGKLSNAQVHEFEEVGHFVAEEAPARILPLLREFLS